MRVWGVVHDAVCYAMLLLILEVAILLLCDVNDCREAVNSESR